MSFDDIPNEILRKILLNLALSDALQFSNVCKRFQQLFKESSKQFYIDIWDPRHPYEADAQYLDCCSTFDSLLVFYRDGSADLFEFTKNSRNLYRTVHVRNAFARGERDHKFLEFKALMPGSRNLVYVSEWDSETGFVVFNLESGKELYRQWRVPEDPIRYLACNSDTICVATHDHDHARMDLLKYSWNGKTEEFGKWIGYLDCPLLAISDNGIVAYYSYRDTSDTIIQFYDTNSKLPYEENKVESGAGGSELVLSRDGTVLLIDGVKSIVIIDVAARKVVAEEEVPSQGLSLLKMSISDDGRFITARLPYNKELKVFCLKRDPESQELSVDYVSYLNCSDYSHLRSVIFREIDGVPVLQLIPSPSVIPNGLDDTIYARLFRLNEYARRWEEME